MVDNDLYNNRIGAGEGWRFANQQGANGGRISARLVGNRLYNNYNGMLLVDNRSNNASVSVISSGDRFYENGAGVIIAAGLSAASLTANGNTISFTAYGTSFENNNGFNNFDFGGLVVLGGEHIDPERNLEQYSQCGTSRLRACQ